MGDERKTPWVFLMGATFLPLTATHPARASVAMEQVSSPSAARIRAGKW